VAATRLTAAAPTSFKAKITIQQIGGRRPAIGIDVGIFGGRHSPCLAHHGGARFDREGLTNQYALPFVAGSVLLLEEQYTVVPFYLQWKQ
jgi:hypothetical protein